MHTVNRHSTFYDVLESLAKPGCAICALVARTRWRYLDSLAYENVNDPGIRAKLRESFGFCNRHAWYFVENVREVFGAAIIYRDILHTVQAMTIGNPGRSVLEPTGICPACSAEWQSAEDALLVIADAIGESDLRAALEASDGLCGHHLLQAMAIMRSDVREVLRSIVLESWRRRQTDVRTLRWYATGAAGNFATDDRPFANQGSTATLATTVNTDDSFACPVCVTVRSELKHVGSWVSLDDGVNGLCNVHAAMPEAEPCAELYRRQMAAIGGRVEELARAPGEVWLRQAMRGFGLGNGRTAIPPVPLQCVVCARQAAIENTLCREVEQPLCLPHLRRAVVARGPTAINAVKPVWRGLDRLLGEYLRKEDYRFRGEPRGIEQRSPRWAVALFAGTPGIR